MVVVRGRRRRHQRVGQSALRLIEPAADGADGDAEHGRDLGVGGAPREVPKHHRRAQIVWQRLQASSRASRAAPAAPAPRRPRTRCASARTWISPGNSRRARRLHAADVADDAVSQTPAAAGSRRSSSRRSAIRNASCTASWACARVPQNGKRGPRKAAHGAAPAACRAPPRRPPEPREPTPRRRLIAVSYANKDAATETKSSNFCRPRRISFTARQRTAVTGARRFTMGIQSAGMARRARPA